MTKRFGEILALIAEGALYIWIIVVLVRYYSK